MGLEPKWSAMTMLAPPLKLHTLHALDACYILPWATGPGSFD